MNRFEALHALGLEEGASDDDIKMALYGIEKSAANFDFSDVEPLARRVERAVSNAGDAKKFMLNSRNRASANQVLSFKDKPSKEKLRVTPLEQKRALLSGTEFIRRQVCIYLGTQQDARRGAIIALLACVAVGFVLLRYVRVLMARIGLFAVVAVVAVAGSTVLTRAILTIRKVKAHLALIDEVIEGYRHDLGLDEDDQAAGQAELLPEPGDDEDQTDGLAEDGQNAETDSKEDAR
jgi:hypothetical protein